MQGNRYSAVFWLACSGVVMSTAFAVASTIQSHDRQGSDRLQDEVRAMERARDARADMAVLDQHIDALYARADGFPSRDECLYFSYIRPAPNRLQNEYIAANNRAYELGGPHGGTDTRRRDDENAAVVRQAAQMNRDIEQKLHTCYITGRG